MNWRILTGDTLALLPTLDAGSVQTCVTSPPYFGLRDYGTASWRGGDASCDHIEPQGGPSAKQESSKGTRGVQYRDVCAKCGAVRVDPQIGLKQTPDAYVEKLVDVFREVRRVLRDDGTLWLNLGDSYASMNRSGRAESPGVGATQAIGPIRTAVKWKAGGGSKYQWRIPAFDTEIKPKDLIGIPWRVAFALQADGWYLRQDIIWHKPNPMPESVRDRCTKAHEYVFLLAKSERYYFDSGAISEQSQSDPSPRNRPNGLSVEEGKRSGAYRPNCGVSETRNKRSVWTVTTKPFKDAHFATFPPGLIRPMILAGSRPGDLVLDPFNGAGTTGLVAVQEGRRYIGCELNPEYVAMAERRIGAAVPLFAVADMTPTITGETA